MRVLARAGLAAIAALLLLGACSTIEPIQEASPLPEPPPWNSIEMLWLETEVVFLQAPPLRPDSLCA